ncbi:neural proliferation differentiation and control 1-like [Brachionus plicatilis]|uniref:Neural proliferation differentiation and control 1-like n=1 Tax=Brachionus plicatilis TaxID=10195 RepID=A0A3M7R5X1_BRAPC|nr:neural proliferation differentiation and control 1-like [Brachionus plicatilis]
MSSDDFMDSCSSIFLKTNLSCDSIFYIIIAAFVFAGLVLILAAVFCWLAFYRHKEKIKETFNPKVGIWNPNFSIKTFQGTNSDRRLAHSAQLYHYQHQKQQMMAMETAEENKPNTNISQTEIDDTVYECPGFASTGEMVVNNPLFNQAFDQVGIVNYKSEKTSPDPVLIKMDSNKKNFD